MTEAAKTKQTETAANPLKKQIQNLLATLSPRSVQPPNFDCGLCEDKGYTFVKVESNGREYSAKKDCACKLEKLRKNRLAKIPPKFADARIENLTPDIKRHPRQAEYVPFIRQNPERSYFFGGRFGTGKTFLSWALYRAAVERDAPRIVFCTLGELLDEYRAFIRASVEGKDAKYPRLAAEDLRQHHTRFSIFLDDIDKAKPTEYAAEQLYALTNAIYEHGHQIIVTTNLRLDDLVKHFERADERFGGAIVRRLVDGAKICEMF